MCVLFRILFYLESEWTIFHPEVDNHQIIKTVVISIDRNIDV